jgi:hypothetical protein
MDSGATFNNTGDFSEDAYKNSADAMEEFVLLKHEKFGLTTTNEITTHDALFNVWRHVRASCSAAVQRFGYPLDEFGVEITKTQLSTLSEKSTYNLFSDTMVAFLQTSNYLALQIMTPTCGVHIRKTLPGESTHKFAFSELSSSNLAEIQISYEGYYVSVVDNTINNTIDNTIDNTSNL